MTDPQHRKLRFSTLDDLRKELETLERAHRAGQLRTTGNWTPGQNLSHLASFIRYAYDGYPPLLQHPPLMLRLIARLLRGVFLSSPLPRGVKIPGVPGGTVGVEDVSFEDGLAMFEREIERLARIAPTRANPLLGNLTHDQWIRLHLRHAELHLGYLQPA